MNTIRSVGRNGVFVGLFIAFVVISIILTKSNNQPFFPSQLHDPELHPKIVLFRRWAAAPSDGWLRSKYLRSDWPAPAEERSNGYLLVHCIGGLYQHRSAISDAVVVARIMNATLVLPELDVNSSWHDDGGFEGIYDVQKFINSLRIDVLIVRRIPETLKIKPYQLHPPKDAPVSWYTTVALEKMREHGAIYLTPFSHSLVEEIDNPEYQRLRCRVNYGGLSFKKDIMTLCTNAYHKLHGQGFYIVIDLQIGMQKQAIAECLDIYTPEKERILKKYPNGNFTEKKDGRAIGNCPLTPEEAGLILRAMGFDNSTRIYVTAGKPFDSERFMKPLRTMFSQIENHSTVNPEGLAGPAIDYLVSLYSFIFMPLYDGPSDVANTLIGHRHYRSMTTFRHDRKALARILIDREKGQMTGFEEDVRRLMHNINSIGPHKRAPHESFYTNPWPECFCQRSPLNPGDKCPSDFIQFDRNRRKGLTL